MKDHYDFSQSVKNPYFEDLQESITPQTTMTMTLNQKQLDILKAIKKLKLTQRSSLFGNHIAQELNFDDSLVGHYLDNLKNQGYINFIQDGVSSSPLIRGGIELTDKGVVAITSPDDLINEDNLIMNNISFNAPINAPIGVLQNSDGNTVNITQNNNQNIQEIINSLEFLEKEIQVFPEEEKQEALVYLDQLKTEIKESQNPAKIRTFFKGFLRIVSVPLLLSLIANGADFANNVTDLATKFDFDISHISLPFK
jgi:DNA-binding MarR family transcriptional regulator